jgi:hypothetical protein
LGFAVSADSSLKEAKNAIRSPVFRGEVGVLERTDGLIRENELIEKCLRNTSSPFPLRLPA